MPIEVDMHDGSSSIVAKPHGGNQSVAAKPQGTAQPVPAMPQDGNQQVRTKQGCEIDNRRLDAKIDKETADRIAADEELDRKIGESGKYIVFVQLDSPAGWLTRDQLASLLSNKSSKLVYRGVIYYLSIVEGAIWKYFSRAQSSIDNEILLDTATGRYETISKMDPAVERHITDSSIHVTPQDKLF